MEPWPAERERKFIFLSLSLASALPFFLGLSVLKRQASGISCHVFCGLLLPVWKLYELNP